MTSRRNHQKNSYSYDDYNHDGYNYNAQGAGMSRATGYKTVHVPDDSLSTRERDRNWDDAHWTDTGDSNNDDSSIPNDEYVSNEDSFIPHDDYVPNDDQNLVVYYDNLDVVNDFHKNDEETAKAMEFSSANVKKAEIEPPKPLPPPKNHKGKNHKANNNNRRSSTSDHNVSGSGGHRLLNGPDEIDLHQSWEDIKEKALLSSA